MSRAPALLSLGGLAILLAAGAPATPPGPGQETGLAHATFSGGCFWCMEHPFDVLPGVVSTTVGYTGGHVADPTYEQVSSGTTGHRESVDVLYDPAKVSYRQLLYVYWRNVDPLDGGGQFCDRGEQYTTAIWYHGEEQRTEAEASRRRLDASGRFQDSVVTKILPAKPFYPAEEYHQDYYEKNPVRYKLYRFGCGRDARLKELWGDEAGGENPPRTAADLPG